MRKRRLQNHLNEERWITSEKLKHNCAGAMHWCKDCTEKVNGQCTDTQYWIDAHLSCARNYIKLKRRKQ